MNKQYKILTLCVLGALLLAAGWTTQIHRTVLNTRYETATQDIQYLYGSPLFGNITLEAVPIMYEGVTATCWVRIMMGIESKTPMDLTIDSFTVELSNSESDSVPEWIDVGTVGGYPMLFVANATSLQYEGHIDIIPETPSGTGDNYLGLRIEYHLRNHTLTTPNAWGGGVGALYMIKVDILPPILRPEGWYYAFWFSFLAVAVIAIINRYHRFL